MKKIADIDVAKAVIAHEKVRCFLGEQQGASKQPKGLVSCIGGTFWGKDGEDWPRSKNGDPLIPWLQVVCTEMKDLYGPLRPRKVVCFYITEDFSDAEATSAFDENDFVVREYLLKDELAPLSRPKELERHQFHRVLWQRADDYPCLSKYYQLFDKSVYDALCQGKPFKYDNRSGIKIGGWPTMVQSEQRYPGEFDMQIDMTENFMYGDAGIGQLSRSGNSWWLMFECC